MKPDQVLDLKMAEPEFINAVVRIQVEFPDDPKTYTYAAVKAAGKWFVTGHGSVGRTWPGLIDLLTRKRATITTALEDLL